MGSCSGFSPKYKLGVFILKNEELKTAINISIVIVKYNHICEKEYNCKVFCRKVFYFRYDWQPQNFSN